jgi:WD40 repeat protein
VATGSDGSCGDDRINVLELPALKRRWIQWGKLDSYPVSSLAVSSQAQLLASTGTTQIRLWNLRDGSPRLVIEGQATGRPWRNLPQDTQEGFLALAFRPDGGILVAGGTGGITLWQVSDGRLLRRWAPEQSISALTLCPSGQRAAIETADGIALYQLSDGVKLWQHTLPSGRMPLSFAFTRDGRLVSGGRGNDKVSIWRAKDGALLQQLPSPLGKIYRVTTSADGRQVVASCEKGLVAWR